MPELPEVETIKRGLQKAIVGKKIARVEVLKEKSFKGDPKDIIGKSVAGVYRRAKYLIVKFNDDLFLVIHLKMTGQLLISPPRCAAGATSPRRCLNAGKYRRVIIDFSDGSKLFFNDLRVFGWMKVVKTPKGCTNVLPGGVIGNGVLDRTIGEKLGPEPFSKELTVDYLKNAFSKTNRPIKLVLADQKKIAGIGNIYANESLFCARVLPTKRAKKLLNREIKKLRDCILYVLKQGIKYGGSTASDDAFRNIKGERGNMQQLLKVYGKKGEACSNKCGRKIERINLGGRGTFYCPACQR